MSQKLCASLCSCAITSVSVTRQSAELHTAQGHEFLCCTQHTECKRYTSHASQNRGLRRKAKSLSPFISGADLHEILACSVRIDKKGKHHNTLHAAHNVKSNQCGKCKVLHCLFDMGFLGKQRNNMRCTKTFGHSHLSRHHHSCLSFNPIGASRIGAGRIPGTNPSTTPFSEMGPPTEADSVRTNRLAILSGWPNGGKPLG